MNRNLILPATISAGLHVLLLGFREVPNPPCSVVSPELPSMVAWPDPRPDPPVFELVYQYGCTGFPPPTGGSCQPGRRSVLAPPGGRMSLEASLRFPLTSESWTGIPPIGGRGIGQRNVGEMVFQWGPLDQNPRALYRTAPRTPSDVGNVSAMVTVEFVVGVDGTVRAAEIADSSDHRFDDECLRAVRRWQFEPGTRYAVPVAFRVQQTFVFNPTN